MLCHLIDNTQINKPPSQQTVQEINERLNDNSMFMNIKNI